MSWQPIETAPKDRDIIITGRYANGRAYVEQSCWHYRGYWTHRQFEPPTHWQPMPQPFGGWDAEPAVERDLTKMEAGNGNV
jgi:hypothetical protein